MLSKPKHGWSDFQLESFTAQVSFLVDVPFDWLRACLNGLKYRIPISFHIDEEGSECIITSYWDLTYIIIDREEEPELKSIYNVNYIDITRMLIEDISTYYDDWVKWSPYEDTDKDFERRRIELKELISQVKNVLLKY